MSDTLTIDGSVSLEMAIARLRSDFEVGKVNRISFELTTKQRTSSQNNALHVACGMLAETLNDAGADMVAVLKEGAEIPWTKESVKTHLWHPVQTAMFETDSTTKLTTKQVNEVYEVLIRHLGQRCGVTAPAFPTRDAE